MARKQPEEKGQWVTAERAKALQAAEFNKNPEQKESSLASICFSIALVTILLGSIIFYLFQERVSKPSASNNSIQPENPVTKEFELEPKSPSVEWTGKLPKEIVNDFHNAETVDDYLEHFDIYDDIENEAREFFSTGPGSKEKIVNIKRLPAVHDDDGNAFMQLRVHLDTDLIRLMYLRSDPTEPKIDFHAYTRHCSHSWEDLLSGKVPEAPEMRLAIRKDNFYLGEFQDDSVWQSFRGITPDSYEHFSLYLRKDQIPIDLQKAIYRNKSVTATVALKPIGDSHQRKQFEITKVHHLHWLTLPTK